METRLGNVFAGAKLLHADALRISSDWPKPNTGDRHVEFVHSSIMVGANEVIRALGLLRSIVPTVSLGSKTLTDINNRGP